MGMGGGTFVSGGGGLVMSIYVHTAAAAGTLS